MTTSDPAASRRRHANVAVFVPHAGCPHDCRYCNQRVIAGTAAPPRAADVRAACERALAARPRDWTGRAEIAFFGGSFTAIAPAYREELLDAAAPYVASGAFDGIRVSTRPDAIDAADAAYIRSRGVTAVELGAQSMDDAVLAAADRGHTAADVAAAARAVREAGLELGLQMMTGLPGSGGKTDRRTAEALAALEPDTVRIYPTVVVAGTRLADDFAAGRYRPPSLDAAVSLCAGLLDYFERERGIRVIRLGLHADPSLEAGLVAGPWHPAFRELCEGELYRRAAEAALRDAPPGPVTLEVHPAAVSKLAGHGRRFLAGIEARGYSVAVRGGGSVPPGEVRLV